MYNDDAIWENRLGWQQKPINVLLVKISVGESK